MTFVFAINKAKRCEPIPPRLITFSRWVVMQCLYWFGVNPEGLGRFYQPVRNAEKAARRNNSGLTDI
jgi:hypothetical protein